MRKALSDLFVFFLLIMITSCASTGGLSSRQTKLKETQYLNDLNDGKYKPCLDYLNSLYKKKKPDMTNRIRDNLDMGMLHHYMGEYKNSLEILNETDALMHQAFTKSITQGIAAAAINDTVKEYGGTAYEYYYINIFNALNYYNLGDFDEAAVEIRKLNNKQKEYILKYGDLLYENSLSSGIDSDDEEEKLEEAYQMLDFDRSQLQGSSPESPTKADIFRDSPLARYLSLLFYMMEGDEDNARLDSKTLAVLNGSFDASDDLKVVSGKGRLNVLAFSGLIGRRGEQRIRIGPFSGIYYHHRTKNGSSSLVIPPFDLEFTYPVYPSPQSYDSQVFTVPADIFAPVVSLTPGNYQYIPLSQDCVTSVKLCLDNGREYDFSLLEDLNYAVQGDVNLKAKAAFSRSVVRSLIKKTTAMITSSIGLTAARESLGDDASFLEFLAYTASYIAVTKTIDAIDTTEIADIRQAYVLPAKANACGVFLEPGVYSFTVKYYSGNKVVYSQKFKDIIIEEGKPTLVESLCAK